MSSVLSKFFSPPSPPAFSFLNSRPARTLTIRSLGADFLLICKPSSHKRFYELLHDDFLQSSGWIRTRNHKRQVELQRYRWMHGLPVRDSDDAVPGTWIEFPIQRQGKRTYSNTFCTSLEVTADNLAAIARLGRARWKIEHEGFNCLARHGYNFKRNFGHGCRGLGQPACHAEAVRLPRCTRCWTACRACGGKAATKPARAAPSSSTLRVLAKRFWFPNWTQLLLTILGQRSVRGSPWPVPS